MKRYAHNSFSYVLQPKWLLVAVLVLALCPVIARAEFVTQETTDEPASEAVDQDGLDELAAEASADDHDQNGTAEQDEPIAVATEAEVDQADEDALEELASTSIKHSGTWGTCKWSIDSTGHLRIWPSNGSSGTLADSRDWDLDDDVTKCYFPWYRYASEIKTATFENGVKLPQNSAGLLADCTNLTSVEASTLDTSQVVRALRMFCECNALTHIDTSKWDVSHIVQAWNMFGACRSLATLDVSQWNTSSLTDMERMFSGCEALTALDVSRWNTAKVTTMEGAFEGCASLTELDTSGWNTAKVTSMNRTFGSCEKLTSLGSTKWNTAAVTDMERAFEDCPSLTELDTSTWNTSKVCYMDRLFYGCSSLTSLNLTKWNNANAEQTSNVFDGCTSLSRVVVGSSYNTAKAFPAMLGDTSRYWWSTKDKCLYSLSQIKSSRKNVADTYTIADLSGATVTATPGTYLYTGKPITPLLSVKLGPATLSFGSDYGISCKNNVKAGTATVTITGRGAFTGTASGTFKIANTLTNPFVDVIEGTTAHAEDIIWLASVGITSGWTESNGTTTFRPNTYIKRGDMAAFLYRLGMRWGLVDGMYYPSDETAAAFFDVDAKTSHRVEILWLAETGISTGWKVGNKAEFRPNEPVKRGQMAAFLWRLANLAAKEGTADIDTTVFRDVDKATSFHDEIWWLAANGISTGWEIETVIEDPDAGEWSDSAEDVDTNELPAYDIDDPTMGTSTITITEYEYRPNDPVKRGDMAAFLHRIDSLDE